MSIAFLRCAVKIYPQELCRSDKNGRKRDFLMRCVAEKWISREKMGWLTHKIRSDARRKGLRLAGEPDFITV